MRTNEVRVACIVVSDELYIVCNAAYHDTAVRVGVIDPEIEGNFLAAGQLLVPTAARDGHSDLDKRPLGCAGREKESEDKESRDAAPGHASCFCRLLCE